MEERLFNYHGNIFPTYITQGLAGEFAFPFAVQFCTGSGLDIGGTDKCHFPGSRPINLTFQDGYTAIQLPDGQYDYIFSSHTLEHLFQWELALKIWRDHLKKGGALFLYLPHASMYYWHPENCRKHKHTFTPEIIVGALKDLGFSTILYGERDLYWSFCVVGIL